MKFYSISIDERKKKYASSFPAFGYPTEEIVCNVCGRKWSSFKKMYEEHRSYTIAFTNDYFSDFMSCEFDYLVNEKVKKYLEEKNIKNVRFAEMPVISKSEIKETMIKEISDKGYDINKMHDLKPKYYRLGSNFGAKLHPDSKVIWMDDGEGRCKHCKYGVGYYPTEFFVPECISLDSWDGSDLFKVKEFMGKLFCTEKLKLLIEEKNFTGVLFKQITCK